MNAIYSTIWSIPIASKRTSVWNQCISIFLKISKSFPQKWNVPLSVCMSMHFQHSVMTDKWKYIRIQRTLLLHRLGLFWVEKKAPMAFSLLCTHNCVTDDASLSFVRLWIELARLGQCWWALKREKVKKSESKKVEDLETWKRSCLLRTYIVYFRWVDNFQGSVISVDPNPSSFTATIQLAQFLRVTVSWNVQLQCHLTQSAFI